MRVWSKDDVETVHVKGRKCSRVTHEGRCLKTSVDEEKRVKPVSLGDVVTPAKNWNLHNGKKDQSRCRSTERQENGWKLTWADQEGRILGLDHLCASWS